MKRLIKRIIKKNKWFLEKNASHFDEANIIKKYLEKLENVKNYCVDIAASDGVSMSNTYNLFKNGWSGIAVEFDAQKFAKLSSTYSAFKNSYLVKTRVTPENVISILESCFCPKDFDFLNLDIDSYEFFVLDEMLQKYRPKLICLEINEKLPPPIKFTVLYDSNHCWQGDHFYGLSICKAYELCLKYNYSIVELEYNNLFLVSNELNKTKALSPEEAYITGYKDRLDRKVKMPYNKNMEVLQNMSKEEAIHFIDNFFVKYKGKYLIE